MHAHVLNVRKHATLNVACVFALLQSAENLCLSVRERGGEGRRERQWEGRWERESGREREREQEREREGKRGRVCAKNHRRRQIKRGWVGSDSNSYSPTSSALSSRENEWCSVATSQSLFFPPALQWGCVGGGLLLLWGLVGSSKRSYFERVNVHVSVCAFCGQRRLIRRTRRKKSRALLGLFFCTTGAAHQRNASSWADSDWRLTPDSDRSRGLVLQQPNQQYSFFPQKIKVQKSLKYSRWAVTGKMASFGKLTDYFNRRKSQEELRLGRSSQRSGSYCCTVAEAR